MQASAGEKFRAAVASEKPLQVVGTINAYTRAPGGARRASRRIYLSGGGVAAASLGLPDLGISTLDDVLTDVRRITDVSDLPLLVDADTGFGSAFNIARTVKSLIKVGAGAMHIEDQVQAKRCGHRPGKEIVARRRWSTGSRRPSMRAPIRLRDHGAHRRARGRRTGSGHRTRLRLRRSRRRHDLSGGHDRAGACTASSPTR